MMVVAREAARAPGKLVLLGEYAVLEGGEAWVAAINRDVRVWIEPAEQPHLVALGAGDLEIPLVWQAGWTTQDPTWRLAAAALTQVCGRAYVRLVVDSRPFFLAGSEGRPTKAGFGSSAAVVAAILALRGLAGHDLFVAAHALHQQFQSGLGSGADIAAAVFGGCFQFRIEAGMPHIKALALPPTLRVLAVWMGESANTRHFVRRVLEWKAFDAARAQGLFAEMRAIVAAGLAAARNHDAPAIIAAAQAYGQAMHQLGRSAGVPIVTPAMERLAMVVGQAAAVKPSGAGGGDMALVFTTMREATQVTEAIEAAGFKSIALTYGVAGAGRFASHATAEMLSES